MIRINVASLKRSFGESKTYEIEHCFSPKEILDDEEVQINHPVKIVLKMTNTGSHLEAIGTVETVVKLVCGRCLEPYDYFLQAEINERYRSAEKNQNCVDDSEKEIAEESISFSGDELNIEMQVLNTIYLSLPMSRVCSESCRGLCPQCGVNLNTTKCACKNENIDPRLAVLQKLLKS